MPIFNMIGGGGGSGLELIEEGTYTQPWNGTSLTIPINTNIKGYGTDDGIFYAEAEPVSPTSGASSVIACYGFLMGIYRERIYFETMCLYGNYNSQYGSYSAAMYSGDTTTNQLHFYANSSSRYFYAGTWNYRIYKLP